MTATQESANEAMTLIHDILPRHEGYERRDFISDLVNRLEAHYYNEHCVQCRTQSCPECDVVGGNDACYFCHPS